jgi:hypothetical protein
LKNSLVSDIDKQIAELLKLQATLENATTPKKASALGSFLKQLKKDNIKTAEFADKEE